MQINRVNRTLKVGVDLGRVYLLNWLCKKIFADDGKGHEKYWRIDRSEGSRKESLDEVLCGRRVSVIQTTSSSVAEIYQPGGGKGCRGREETVYERVFLLALGDE